MDPKDMIMQGGSDEPADENEEKRPVVLLPEGVTLDDDKEEPETEEAPPGQKPQFAGSTILPVVPPPRDGQPAWQKIINRLRPAAKPTKRGSTKAQQVKPCRKTRKLRKKKRRR